MELIVGHTYKAHEIPVGTVYTHPGYNSQSMAWVVKEKKPNGDLSSLVSHQLADLSYTVPEGVGSIHTDYDSTVVILQLPKEYKYQKDNDPKHQGRWKGI